MFATIQQPGADLSSGRTALLPGLVGGYLDRAPDFDLSSPQRYWESRRANPAAYEYLGPIGPWPAAERPPDA
jgi:hypothetical protein